MNKEDDPYNDDLDDILGQGTILWKKKDPTSFLNLTVDSKHLYSVVYEINPDVISKIQVDKESNTLLGKSPHYTLFPLTQEMIKEIPDVKIDEARKNPGIEISLDAGGTRNMNEPMIHQNYSSTGMEPIAEQYRQHTYKYDNHCVWLATAMLINTIDPTSAQCLTDACMREPLRFQWLRMFKDPKNKVNSLYSCLKYVKSNFEVCKIKGINSKKVYNYIMNEALVGTFVVTMEDNMGQQTHSIGIDAKTRLIYDCLENNTLRLCKKNLSRCCGEGHTFIAFKYYAEIRKQR